MKWGINMAMSQLDKMKLLGVIKKNQINEYDDLYIESRSNLSIFDFLSTTINIANKLIEENANEKQIENALKAIYVIVEQIFVNSLSVPSLDHENICSLSNYENSYNNNIKELIQNIIILDQRSLMEYQENPEYETEDNETIVDSNDELDEQEDNHQELEEKIIELNEKIKSLTRSLAKKDSNCASQDKKLKENIQTIRDLKEEIKKLTKMVSKLESSHKVLKEEYDQAAKELSSLKRQYEMSSEMNSKLQSS